MSNNKKRVLITGASGGLGLKLVEQFSSEDYEQVLLTRNPSELCVKSGKLSVYCDLQDSNSIYRAYSRIREMGLFPDIIINSAGLFHIKNIFDVSEEEYDKYMAVNVKAPFLLTKLFAPHMIEEGWGRVVYVGSSSCYGGSAETGVYCVSKHALLGLSRSFHDELKKHGVKVCCVSPGSMQTPMSKDDTRQQFSTFLDPGQVAKFIFDLIKYEGNISFDEVRVNRETVK